MATQIPSNHQLYCLFHRLNFDRIKGGDIPTKVEAGIPNITGTFSGDDDNAKSGYTGCFELTDILTAGQGASTGNDRLANFNAQRSNPIFGNSDTVQPPALQLIPQIKY